MCDTASTFEFTGCFFPFSCFVSNSVWLQSRSLPADAPLFCPSKPDPNSAPHALFPWRERGAEELFFPPFRRCFVRAGKGTALELVHPKGGRIIGRRMKRGIGGAKEAFRGVASPFHLMTMQTIMLER